MTAARTIRLAAPGAGLATALAVVIATLVLLGPAVRPATARTGVDQLLSRAEAALAAKRLTTPYKKSAVYFYRRVLKADPGNSRAKAGLAKVADTYLAWARREIEAGRLGRATSFLDRLESFDPGNTGLKPLRRTIENDRRTAEDSLARAGERLGAGDPAGAAIELETARRVLGRTGDFQRLEKKVKARLKKVGARLERLIDQAEAALARRQYVRVVRLVDQGRKLSPGDRRLDDLERTALEGLDRGQTARMDDYIARAGAALERGDNETASELLDRAAMINPDHPELRAMTARRAATDDLETAALALDQGELAIASDALDRSRPLLGAEPRHAELTARLATARQTHDQGRTLLARAEVDLAAGRLEQAAEAARQAVALSPRDPAALKLLASAEGAIRERDAGRAARGGALLEAARKAMGERRFIKADALLDRAAELVGADPRLAALRSELAEQSKLVPGAGDSEWISPLGLDLVLIPAGDFQMGSPPGFNVQVNETPNHRVVISKPFWMGRTEVTRGQWRKVMEPDYQPAEDDDMPMAGMDFHRVMNFINRLNHLEKTTAYRLPTEAEWEYACRAGTETPWSFGPDSSGLGENAWHIGNSGLHAHPVGKLKSNPWGLFDMHGNVQEWCSDYYSDDYYAASPEVDPAGPEEGGLRTARGGSFLETAGSSRSAIRIPGAPRFNLGFRIVRSE